MFFGLGELVSLCCVYPVVLSQIFLKGRFVSFCASQLYV